MLLGTQAVNEKGHLEIGGCDTVELAQKFGTPLYIMDEKQIRDNCRAYKQAFTSKYPNCDIAFAGKAFLTTAFCKLVEQEGFSLDVASGGELFTAQNAGFPMDRIVFHGNNKSEDELRMAVQAKLGHVVVDSLLEIENLNRIAAENGQVVNVLIRCTPGIDPHTHKRIRTGQEDSKFGLNIKDGKALAGVLKVVENKNLCLRGLHCHVGSQLIDISGYREAIGIMANFMKTLKDQYNIEIKQLDLGGGLGIRYQEKDVPPSIEKFAEEICDALKTTMEKAGLVLPQLMLEPGRSIVGEAGTTIYRIGIIKEVHISKDPGKRTYVGIDGGLSDNPRPQMYEAQYEAMIADRAGDDKDFCATVAGKHCETDILIWDVMIQKPQVKDVLAVQSTGAYNYTMASNYNRLCRPAVVLVADGKADLIVARETYQDLVKNDVVPERFR